MLKGLSTHEARQKLSEVGPNTLPTKSTLNIGGIFFAQFKNVLSIILIVASLLSFLIGDKIDALFILVILLLNSALGFWQEFKSSRELLALRQMEVLSSRVMRDGSQVLLPASQIVPGDIVVLEAGDKVPADGKLVESFELTLDESSLSGESLPIIKSTKDSENRLFLGTTVVSGRGLLLVEKTGLKTKFGQIAQTLSQVEEKPTPLEVSLSALSKRIGIVVLLISLGLFIVEVWGGVSLLESLFSSIALLVAAVPEGLPTVITVLLSIGVHNLYQRKTLVRRLSSIESLGATNIICTDKTGTLTKNEMSVSEVAISESHLTTALLVAVLCNSASIVLKEDHPLPDNNTEDRENYTVLGDTTEGALLFWALQKGLDIDEIRNSGKIITESPFNLQRRMMSVLWEDEKTKKKLQLSKGSPEVILSLSKLTVARRKTLEAEYQKMAEKGLRVLGLACLKNPSTNKIVEKDLEFLGFVGIADSPRLEAKEAISQAEKAGIRVIMVTGDNALTAKYIAAQVGLFKSGDEVMTGMDLEEMDDVTLEHRLSRVSVFARVQPESKLRIVQMLQKMGQVVAVTGDGVNDVLALKQAHVGVAMGITGTDVAKEASDIIILDDNLATIVAAIAEGRLIYNNIVKVIKFLLTGNLSELLLIVLAVLAGFPVPLLPVQLLWINLVTDGLPALSLAADPPHYDIMSRSPRSLSEPLLNGVTTRYIVLFGLIIAVINILVFSTLYAQFGIQVARGTVFSLVVVSQMVLIFIVRGKSHIFRNKYLLGSVGLILLLQLSIVYFAPLRQLFKF